MADVEITKGGTTVMTGDAIELMRWQCLKSGLEGYAKFGMIPTRGVTITKVSRARSTSAVMRSRRQWTCFAVPFISK